MELTIRRRWIVHAGVLGTLAALGAVVAVVLTVIALEG